MARFSYYKDPGMVKELLLQRSRRNVGGVECLIVGKPGCGKTTALSQIALLNQSKYGDVVLFRGSEDCQWSYLVNANKDLDLILKEGWEMTLYNRKTGKVVDPETIFRKVKIYKTGRILVESKLSHKNFNVIQTTPYTPIDPKQHLQFCLDWLEIFLALNQRRWDIPVSVCFDEFEDLVPEGVGKHLYDIELSLSGLFRKNRKNDISTFLACHALEDVHWRVKKKIRWMMYMRGAKQSKDSAIRKNLADLPVGIAMLEGDKFERFEFEPLGNELKLRATFRKSPD